MNSFFRFSVVASMLALSVVRGQPSVNGITIGDNSYADWGSLTALASYRMWEAGQQFKNNGDPRPLISTAYDFVDCQTEQSCILVLTVSPPYYLGSDLGEMWIKDYNGPTNPQSNIEGTKAFITNSAGSRIGWEGCFPLARFNQQDSRIEIHGGFDEKAEGGGRTTSTGKDLPFVKLNFTCDRIVTNDTCPTDPLKMSPGICGCGVPDVDTDRDGFLDCRENCTLDVNKTQPGLCGCGIPDTDTDRDGTPDCRDNCTLDASKTNPGLCGCGVSDRDSDGDGTPDCRDNCTLDANKTQPGVCGCGIPDVDTDRDGKLDCNETCHDSAIKTEPGFCGCYVLDTDRDGDGTHDCHDSCPDDRNKITPGFCGCGRNETGDRDGDGVHDCNDVCPDDRNKATTVGRCGCGKPDTDTDRDGVPDCDDVCPTDPNKKLDKGHCGCNVDEVDTDGAGTPDCIDLCPNNPDKTEPGVCNCSLPDIDTDGDKVMDCIDGCPSDGFKTAPGDCGCGYPEVPGCGAGGEVSTCSVTGDPHITTCDGFYYSCQGQGEFILLKSGRREVQARFMHFDFPRLWSMTRAVVVQDVGTTPRVQISEPEMSGPSVTMPSGCKLQLYVNGMYNDLAAGYNSNGVFVAAKGHTVIVRYPATGFQVQIDTSIYMNHCVLNAVVSVPVGDATVGLLGSIDRNALNDWMLRNGTAVPVSHSLSSRDHYDYCTKNWCITDASESLFTYEPNYGHANITRCKHPYTEDQTLEEVPQDVYDECGDNVPCIIDTMKTNAMVARRSDRTREASSLASRNGYGGECETDNNCFAPMKCIDLGGLQGKKCLSELPTCMWDWGDCSLVSNCCDGVCTDIGNGEKQCRKDESLPQCMWDRGDCSVVSNCCEGQCVTLNNGQKQCQIPECKVENVACAADADCCSGLTCRGGQCRSSCKSEMEYCDQSSDCCSGLICDVNRCRSKACLWWGGACSKNADCCSGYCNGNVCN